MCLPGSGVVAIIFVYSPLRVVFVFTSRTRCGSMQRLAEADSPSKPYHGVLSPARSAIETPAPIGFPARPVLAGGRQRPEGALTGQTAPAQEPCSGEPNPTGDTTPDSHRFHRPHAPGGDPPIRPRRGETLSVTVSHRSLDHARPVVARFGGGRGASPPTARRNRRRPPTRRPTSPVSERRVIVIISPPPASGLERNRRLPPWAVIDPRRSMTTRRSRTASARSAPHPSRRIFATTRSAGLELPQPSAQIVVSASHCTAVTRGCGP